MDLSVILTSAATGAFVGIILNPLIAHLFNLHRDKVAQTRLTRDKERESTAAVVEILSEWVRSTYLGRAPTSEELWKLQTIYWKNILLLDRELISALFPTLANAKDAPGTNEVIAEARRILLRLKKADLKGTDLNNWPPLIQAAPKPGNAT